MTRRTTWGVGALAATTVALVGVLLLAARPVAATTPPAGPPATASVERTTLTQTEDVDGTLGFGDARPVAARLPGTLTAVAAAGTTVHRGETLFEVDTDPVVLMIGAMPAYRALQSGDEGADVAQLEENLAALGYTGFTVDDEFTSATADAVQEWQEDHGLAETGRVELGRIVFAPADVRVSEVSAQVGEEVGGPVLSITGTIRQVDVDIPVQYRELVATGSEVRIELPGGQDVPGTVRSVGASAEQVENDDLPPGVSATYTVPVVIDVSDPAAAEAFDQAPVTVTMQASRAQDVLTVPVSALLALAEGGYGLEVVENGASRVVAVDTGVFAGGKVEVSGGGIAEGTVVGVPAR